MKEEGYSIMKPEVKFSLSASLWMLAFILDVVSGFSYNRTLFALAMTFAFAGDVWLLMYGKNRKVKTYFIIGLVSFAMAHVIYAQGFLNRLTASQLAARPGETGEGLILYMFLVLLPTAPLMTLNIKIDNRLLIGSYVYWAIIVYAFMTIWEYSIVTTKVLPGIGISLFLISDLMIAVREFLGVRTRKIDIGIWTLYVAGQVMLLIG